MDSLAAMQRLLEAAEKVRANSTAPVAADFNVSLWLSEWIILRQPALGGVRPVDLLDSDAGVDSVVRLIGAMQSGAFP